jgi:hypothetical protein
MPLTVVLNLQSIAMPNIINPIRVDVATQDNPTSIVATETDTTAGHPARIWSFPGLPRTNYVVVMNEISGGAPVNQLAYFDVVPDSISGDMVREDEQLIGGVTPGFDVGLNHVVFDGTNNLPDYRGWNINPERRNGGGTMQRGVEYSWDKDTGDFYWLQSGDQILPNELYNIDFDPIATPAGGSVPPSVVVGFTTRLITSSDSILDTDLGTNIIVEPAGNYLELTLPAANSSKDGLPISISVFKSATCCVKLIGSIKFEYGANMFLTQGESVEIYCFIRSAGNNEWRYRNANAGFASVGRLVYSDNVTPINGVAATGTLCDLLTHARLWQWVQSLPPAYRQSFANWGSNQTFFSDTDGTGFHVPNRANLYARPSKYGDIVGSLVAQQIASHKHMSPFASSFAQKPFGSAGFRNKLGSGSEDNDNDYWFTNDGTEIAGAAQMNPANLIGSETRPNSFITNSYILL